MSIIWEPNHHVPHILDDATRSLDFVQMTIKQDLTADGWVFCPYTHQEETTADEARKNVWFLA